MSELLLDRAGRRRSPATMPGFHAGRPPHNKGLRVSGRSAQGRGDRRRHARRRRPFARPPAPRPDRVRRRAGLRIHEALALTEGDLDERRGSLLIRHGKGGRRREVGLDAWGWEELRPWLERRPELPVGALLCVINGTTCGRHWSPAAARAAHGGRGRGSAPLRAAPTAPRPRRRDGPRRRPADRDPAPTRPQQPRDHLRRPARHRQRRDHRDRARATSADDSGQRLRATLIHRPVRRRSSREAQAR